ncbi:hypothetical protein AGMMS49960_18740 [Betaproteobacteria bacterium]|nr:hypothetical protein AGMMS49543_25360 [Betaproteobacteria bacterium]GHU03837.1 hypothetical protein AGMMS49960_18740 [Betaproteobacteria bacterium]
MKPSREKDALTQTEMVNSLGMCFVHLPAGSYQMGAGALFLMFAYVTGWMALEGDRAWYGGVLPALLFGRYAQKGAVGEQFFSYVWKAFLVVVFVDVVLHEVLQ